MSDSVKIALILGAVAIACVWIYSEKMSLPEGVTVERKGQTWKIEQTKPDSEGPSLIARIWDLYLRKILTYLVLFIVGGIILWGFIYLITSDYDVRP